MRRCALHILAALLLLLPLAAGGHALEVSYEYPQAPVEAAFVYNLARFVTWPAAAFRDERSSLVLAVLDPEVYRAAKPMLEGRRVAGRALEVRAVSRPEQALDAHILFIGPAATGSLQEFLSALQGRPLLTVGRIDGFAGRGGMVELFMEGHKLRFGIELQAAREAGLGVSSEVLQLASFVRGGER